MGGGGNRVPSGHGKWTSWLKQFKQIGNSKTNKGNTDWELLNIFCKIQEKID